MSPDEIIGRTLLGLAVVIAATGLLTPVLRRLAQPAVLAQVLAGILLGPTLLGAFPGDPDGWLFPPEVRSALSAVGTVGLVLFLFLMGLGVDTGAARRGGRRLAAVTLGSSTLPFALGILCAVTLLRGDAPAGVSELGFVLFVGTALSISALPVLARILDERRLSDSPVGQLALASASLQDASAWLLLTAVLALAGDDLGQVGQALAGLAALVLALACVFRPALRSRRAAQVVAGLEVPDGARLALLLLPALACAALTQLTGLHAALGALACGFAVPAELKAPVREELERVLGPLVRGVLLPVYFLTPGLSFSLGALGGPELLEVLVLLACACGGKLLGAGVPARLTGLGRPQAAAVGVLLNTRGLVELIVLGVGLSAGLIDQTLFSQLALVALITTFLTGPLLRLVASDAQLREEPAARPRTSRRLAHAG